MNLKKQLGLSLVIGGGLLLGLSATPANAQARTYVRYYENIPNKTVSVTNKNAYVYNNGRLSRKMGTMRYYGSKVEEYYAAHVTKNGKTSVYYKFRVGHRTGWVWHGYLKSIASSTGTTPTIPTSGANTQTTGGKSIAPSTTVENVDWNALEKDPRSGIDAGGAYLMQLFPHTIYSSQITRAANDVFDSGYSDAVDFDDSTQSIQETLGEEHVNGNGAVIIRVDADAPYDHVAMEQALEKAGYGATARAKYTGWSIGAQYAGAELGGEAPEPGYMLIILVPNP
ncbi:hypothetical protein ACFP1H_04130 [Secundilactobacillus hailunensis]|uniref:D-alanyl-D-alanine carboxypeptidase n=1 Tax=Secundilactobacillus hailunensis TaxID=2559923 RepID=A0ABW1T7Z8_9LACO|nr:hypothetical protein [Secundilactobacillus hailunensis]